MLCLYNYTALKLNKGVSVGVWASVTACLSVALHVNCCYSQSPWGKTGIIKLLDSIHLGWWDTMTPWQDGKVLKKDICSLTHTAQRCLTSIHCSLNPRIIHLRGTKESHTKKTRKQEAHKLYVHMQKIKHSPHFTDSFYLRFCSLPLHFSVFQRNWTIRQARVPVEAL